MKVISIFKKHSFDELAADFAHLFEVNCRQKLSDETLELWKGCTTNGLPNISRRKRRTISALFGAGSTARRCAI